MINPARPNIKPTTVVLFDGECVLCNFWVSTIKKNKHSDKFQCVSLQTWLHSESDNLNTNLQEIKAQFQDSFTDVPDSVIVLKDNRMLTESDAVLVVISMLAGPIRILLIGYVIPKGVRNVFYRWVAKNRYRWFGRKKFC